MSLTVGPSPPTPEPDTGLGGRVFLVFMGLSAVREAVTKMTLSFKDGRMGFISC